MHQNGSTMKERKVLIETHRALTNLTTDSKLDPSELGFALKSRKIMKTELPRFVKRVEEFMADVKKFSMLSEKALDRQPSERLTMFVRDRTRTHTEALMKLMAVVNVELPVVDVNNPLLVQDTHNKGPRPRSSIKTSIKRRLTSPLTTPVMRSLSTPPDVYDTEPRHVFGSFGSRRGEFRLPISIALNLANKEVIIADKMNLRACVYGDDYQYKLSHDLSGQMNDLCVIPGGNIATVYGNRIEIHDNSGILERIIGQAGKTPGQFDNACGITADVTGRIYVCDKGNKRIQVYDNQNSAPCIASVHKNNTQTVLDSPCSLAINPLTNQIYVADESKNCVFIFNQNQSLLGNIANVTQLEGFEPRYVSFRDDGLLCISDWSSNVVHLVRDGRLLQTLGGKGGDPGMFSQPSGTAFTPRGELIVCDTNNHRIQVFVYI